MAGQDTFTFSGVDCLEQLAAWMLRHADRSRLNREVWFEHPFLVLSERFVRESDVIVADGDGWFHVVRGA